MVFSARTVNICHTIMAKVWQIPTSNAESATVLRLYRPLYDWFIEKLGIFPSHQYKFASSHGQGKREGDALVDISFVFTF